MSTNPSADQARPDDQGSPRLEGLQTVFNGFLALFALVGLVIGCRELRYISEQIKVAERANKVADRSAKAAEKAASAAKDAVTRTDKVLELMRLDQRPWIALEVSGMRPLTDGQELVCRFQTKNVGKLPAYLIETGVGYIVLQTPAKGQEIVITNIDEVGKNRRIKETEHQTAAIPPGGGFGFEWGTEDVMTNEVIEKIGNGNATLIVVARLRYLDTDGCLHKTTGCYRFSRDSQQLRGFEKYNEMD